MCPLHCYHCHAEPADCNWSCSWSWTGSGAVECACVGVYANAAQLIEWPSLGLLREFARLAVCPSSFCLSIPAVCSPHVSHALFGLSRWQVFALDGAASAAFSTCNLQLAACHLPPADCSWRSSGLNLTFDCILIKKWSNIRIKSRLNLLRCAKIVSAWSNAKKEKKNCLALTCVHISKIISRSVIVRQRGVSVGGEWRNGGPVAYERRPWPCGGPSNNDDDDDDA